MSSVSVHPSDRFGAFVLNSYGQAEIGEGAILPWSTSASRYYDEITSSIAEKIE